MTERVPVDAALSDQPAPPRVARSSIRRNVAAMTTGQAVSWTLATISASIVPRYLGPETLGGISLAYSFWAMAAVFVTFGTSQHLQLAIARDQHEGLRLVAPVIAIRTGLFAVSTVILAGYTIIAADQRADFVVYMTLIGVTTLLGQWTDTFSASLMGLERMSAMATTGAVFGVLGLGATIAVLAAGFQAVGMLSVYLAQAAVWLAIVVGLLLRTTSLERSGWVARVRPVLRASAPFVVVTAALAVYRNIDVVVIAQVAEDRDLGWYSVADRLCGSLLFPTTMVLAAIFPTLGRLFETDPAGLRDLVRRAFSLLLVVAVPLGLGAIAVGPTFASLLFGDEFDGAGTLLMIFGPVTVLTFATTLFSTIAVISERQWYVAGLLLACAALTVVLDLLLVPWAANRYDNGAIGGVLAYCVTEATQFAVGIVVVVPYLMTRSLVWQAVRVLSAGGAMLAAVWPLRDRFVLLPVAVGAVVYVLAIVLVRALSDDQRQLLGDIVRRIKPSDAAPEAPTES